MADMSMEDAMRLRNEALAKIMSFGKKPDADDELHHLGDKMQRFADASRADLIAAIQRYEQIGPDLAESVSRLQLQHDVMRSLIEMLAHARADDTEAMQRLISQARKVLGLDH